MAEEKGRARMSKYKITDRIRKKMVELSKETDERLIELVLHPDTFRKYHAEIFESDQVVLHSRFERKSHRNCMFIDGYSIVPGDESIGVDEIRVAHTPMQDA